MLDTDKGLVVVSGCGHVGIINTPNTPAAGSPGHPGSTRPWRISSVWPMKQPRLDSDQATLERKLGNLLGPPHRNRARF